MDTPYFLILLKQRPLRMLGSTKAGDLVFVAKVLPGGVTASSSKSCDDAADRALTLLKSRSASFGSLRQYWDAAKAKMTDADRSLFSQVMFVDHPRFKNARGVKYVPHTLDAVGAG